VQGFSVLLSILKGRHRRHLAVLKSDFQSIGWVYRFDSEVRNFGSMEFSVEECHHWQPNPTQKECRHDGIGAVWVGGNDAP
jgi:hypothetical protein